MTGGYLMTYGPPLNELLLYLTISDINDAALLELFNEKDEDSIENYLKIC